MPEVSSASTAELFAELHARALEMRFRLARLRDSALTEAELTAVLAVYAEFGR
jgi:hypothetical protein